MGALSDIIKSDLYRYEQKTGLPDIIKALLVNKGFQVSFYYRIANYFYNKNNKIALIFIKPLYFHVMNKNSVDFPYITDIGYGLYIGHTFGIVVNGKSKIGNNVNLSHCVTIGRTNRGERIGVPIIGDEVYIGPGAKVIGGINVGNRVAIGANAVVINDLENDAVAVGVPARVVSHEGSSAYINRKSSLENE